MPVTYIPFIKAASTFPPGTKPISPFEIIALDKNTTGMNFSATYTDELPFYFTDSGTDRENYGSNENFFITFYSNTGLRLWVQSDSEFNYHDFEEFSYSQYDRLGFQVGQDEKSLVNFSDPINAPWLQTSSTTTPPWSKNFGGSKYNSSSSVNGWIFPSSNRRAEMLGQMPGRALDVNYPCVRFYFSSDGSSQRKGWYFSVYPLAEKKGEEERPPEEPPKEEPPMEEPRR
jgi:hypothetical protein